MYPPEYLSRCVAMPVEPEMNKGVGVSTCYMDDIEQYETALVDEVGIHPVQWYETKQEAIEGHWRWINDAKHISTVVEIADGANRRYTNEGIPKLITLIRTRSTMLQ